MAPRITITIDRGDVEDWLSEGDPKPEQTTRRVHQYADALKAEMARLNPGIIVAVHWGTGMMGHKIAIDGIPEGDELDLLESLEWDYEAACTKLNSFDWLDA
jgi:hypothetical protein